MKVLLIVLVLLLVSTWAYQDAEREQENYTDMVCSGVWPDYRGLDPQCESRK